MMCWWLMVLAQLAFQPRSATAQEALADHIKATLYWWHIAALRLNGPSDGSGPHHSVFELK